jgi:hypothetical protein
MQIETQGELEHLGGALLESLFSIMRGIRLLGVSLSSVTAERSKLE